MTAHYVAILGTGGISYSGRVFVAVSDSEAAARTLAASKYLGTGSRTTPYGDVLRTALDVHEYFGIRTYGPIEDGTAVEGD